MAEVAFLSMKENKKSQRISLLVDGHKLSLEVTPEEESLYRQAAKTYNQRVNQYRARYTGDEEYPVLMAAVDMALQLEVYRQRLDHQPVEEQLEKLNNELNSFLSGVNKEFLV